MSVKLAFSPRNLPLGSLPSAGGLNNTMLSTAWLPYTRGDMPLTVVRNRVVDDGGHVWESELRGADRGAYSPDTCRNEAWLGYEHGGGYPSGSTLCVGFGLWLAPDYPAPPGWSTCGWQLHTPTPSPAGYASPMVMISSDGGTLSVLNGALGIWVDRWPFDRGRWHYILMEILISQEGRVRLWRSLDTIPDHTKPPTVNYAMATLPPVSAGQTLGPSWTKWGQYRKVGDSNTNIIRLDAPTEATTMAELVASLKSRCRPAAVGTTPPPPPPPPPDGFMVRLLSETATTVTFGWDQVVGARGFRYTRPDGKVSHTWNGATVSVKFAKMDGVYLIEPLHVTDIGQGVYPPIT